MKLSNNQLSGLLYYMKERESIRLAKTKRKPWPWTTDPILQQYKFTNVRRLHDRTTQELLAHYSEHLRGASEPVKLYNCAVARYFGTSAFKLAVGWMTTHNPRALKARAKAMRALGQKVFTGAYIITNGGRPGPKENLVVEYLAGLWTSRRDVAGTLQATGSWESAYARLVRVPGFGGSGFMAKEVLQDWLLITDVKVRDASTWTPMGPGARRGMNRLLGRGLWHRQPERVFIDECVQLWRQLEPWWRDVFPGNGRITAHDVQFCLCEFDKYERTRLMQGKPRSKYQPPRRPLNREE